MKSIRWYNTAFKNKFGDWNIKKLLIRKGDFNNLMKKIMSEEPLKGFKLGVWQAVSLHGGRSILCPSMLMQVFVTPPSLRWKQESFLEGWAERKATIKV